MADYVKFTGTKERVTASGCRSWLAIPLREDLGDDGEGVGGLTASADPVLAELWGNSKDAEYDRL